ncbi:MAG: vanadium-dependent haloperoxidase [Isosphaeraceae bacterium]|nr:vanadium-dependent haloperoxidase [Isosphaeraceae bacterium]
MTSLAYTAAFYEVKVLGAADSTVRTPDQTEAALFWAYDRPSKGTPLILYNEIAQTVARAQYNSLAEDARLFALLNLAMADAGISVWNAKYTYQFWRPVTAIQEAERDGNPFTIADPSWTPLGAPNDPGEPSFTPPFPSYTSGHSTFGAAAFRILADFYGSDRYHLVLHSDELPGVTRTFDSFSAAAAENGRSRIYLGIHWSFDDAYGQATGRAVGDYIFENFLLAKDDHPGLPCGTRMIDAVPSSPRLGGPEMIAIVAPPSLGDEGGLWNPPFGGAATPTPHPWSNRKPGTVNTLLPSPN